MSSKYNLIIVLFLLLLGCERSIDEDILPPDLSLPPYDLKIYSAFDGRITFDWNSVNLNDISFNVYRSVNDSSNFILIDRTFQNFYTDDSLNYDTTYFYYVTSVYNNTESSRSNIISAEPINIYAPLIPRFLEINARNWEGIKNIYLSWEANIETDVIGYNIYKDYEQDFDIDSTNLFIFSSQPYFNDTTEKEFYKEVFYKITAVDQDKLESKPSTIISDFILDTPEIVFPINGGNVKEIQFIELISLPVYANHKIILQENEFYGEIWSTEFTSNGKDDTLKIRFDFPYLKKNNVYYWRVISFTKSTNANSISKKYHFTFDP